LAYCEGITTSTGGTCAYDSTVSANCVARACGLWANGSSTGTCADYLGTKTCAQNTNDNSCLPIGSCSSYTIPSANVSNAS
jgi:hypothetical protein